MSELCEYDKCPAKSMIDNLVKDKDKMENKVDKIEGKLTYHMTKSDEKHTQILEAIHGIHKAFADHTTEEMDLQKGHKKEMETMNGKIDSNSYKTNIMWLIASSLGTLLLGGMAYGIKIMIDVIAPN